MWQKLIAIWRTDNLLAEAWQESFDMLNITHEMFLEAVRVLREEDSTNVKVEIRKKDRRVNAYVRDVRKKVVTHLASAQAPSDLGGGLVLVSIVIDIERLGDYTKNIFDLAVLHPRRLRGDLFEEEISKLESAIKDSFVRTKACIETSEASEALDLLNEYGWVNVSLDKNLNRLINNEGSELSSGIAVSLALYFRWLKRVNSHLRNILSSVINPFHRVGFMPVKSKSDE